MRLGMTTNKLTPSEQRLLAVLQQLAPQGHLPTNAQLSDLARIGEGTTGEVYISRLLRGLAAKGKLLLDSAPHRKARRVMLLSGEVLTNAKPPREKGPTLRERQRALWAGEEATLLAELHRCVAAGLPMPTDAQLAGLLGRPYPSATQAVLKRLVRAGHLRVESRPHHHGRIVHLSEGGTLEAGRRPQQKGVSP